MASTGVPSRTVVMIGALMDGAARMFAPAPSVATITKPGVTDGVGDGSPGGAPPDDGGGSPPEAGRGSVGGGAKTLAAPAG
jgi:hypothetical protein